MRKLIAGIMEFRRLRRADYEETFAQLALGQRPDVLFIACSDSRVAMAEPNLRSWLRHAEPALEAARKLGKEDVNTVSKLNVLRRLEHIAGYPVVKSRVEQGELQLHGLWFDIRHADVYFFERSTGEFVLIDDEEGARVLQRLKG